MCVRIIEGTRWGRVNILSNHKSFSVVVSVGSFRYIVSMANEHVDTTPAWVENSAFAAPAILGAAVGFLVGDLMHSRARRGVGITLGILGITALLPFAVDGVAGLVTGPKSKFGVKRKIQKIRDAGVGSHGEGEVEASLLEHGVM